MTDTYTSGTFAEQRIAFELDVELERAQSAYRATRGGTNETQRAFDRYLNAIENLEAFTVAGA